ncbi:MAG: methyltransferase domain-containing protein [Candidatus Eremiobacteraeota bacterium]|nr:methyltransferase domain-containing protein [Candidatus Eremiobacteraeota bacterium]
MEKNPFDAMAHLYDLMVPWESRLSREEPFYRKVFGLPGKRILDAACGTGRHALLFHSFGHAVTATDLSEAALTVAKKHAASQGSELKFVRENLLSLEGSFGEDSFDFLTILGNSLAQFKEAEALTGIFRGAAAILAPGGTLLFQIVNFHTLTVREGRFMPLRVVRDGERELLFQKIFEFCGSLVVLDVLIFAKRGSQWERHAESTVLRPWSREELEPLLMENGFAGVSWYGDFSFAPFERETSKDLIAVAKVPH